MSPSYEFEDKTVERAVQKACEKLNIPREKLKHNVISYGSTGIFGLVGSKKARIRVTIPDITPQAEPKALDADQYEDVSPEPIAEMVSPAADQDFESEAYPDSDDPKTLGTEALQRIINLITSDATISIEEKSDRLLFNINGGNAAVLIGKRGQTLEAMQYLVEKMINKRRAERIRVQVDVEGYLKKRRISLQKHAGRLAEKVKRTGRPATLGHMNAHDRRIVHLALKNNQAVRTQSRGEGYLKKLVIYPKRSFARKKRPDG